MLAAMNLLPNQAGSGRMMGHGGARFAHARFIRTDQNFHICRLGKRHLASIALGLGIISLLLVIFAYHGGYGVGSWFYSLLVVISGLAFVVFGPLLLCRFLMHAYYRQLDGHPSAQADSDGTGVSRHERMRRTPHVYACIIIAPEVVSEDVFDSRLPTYEEAVVLTNSNQSSAGANSPKTHANVSTCGGEFLSPAPGGGARRVSSGSHIGIFDADSSNPGDTEGSPYRLNRCRSSGALRLDCGGSHVTTGPINGAFPCTSTSAIVTSPCHSDDLPPPSYSDALAQMQSNSQQISARRPSSVTASNAEPLESGFLPNYNSVNADNATTTRNATASDVLITSVV